MFGKITTKADPKAAFTKAIDKAISDATHGISTADVVGYLRSRAQQIEDTAYRPVPTTKVYGTDGKLIDWDAKVQEAQRERQRRIDEACVIPRDKRQSAASGYKV